MCLIGLIKKLFIFIFIASVLLLLLTSKCSLGDLLGDVSDSVLPDQVSISVPAESMPLTNKVKDQVAAEYKIPASEVEITHFEFIIWPNDCLGDGFNSCDNVATPGYKIKVMVKGKEIEYHTDKQGNQIVKI